MDFSSFFTSVSSIINTIEIWDIIDVLIMSFVIYQVLMLAKKSRMNQLLKGLLLLFVFYVVAAQLGLKTVVFLLNNLLQFGFIGVIVVFQPEIRRMLEQMGRTSIFSLGIFQKKAPEEEEIDELKKTISSICDSAKSMSESPQVHLWLWNVFPTLAKSNAAVQL